MYGQVGVLAAMSLVHGGASFALFSPTVFNFLCDQDAVKLQPKVEEVADAAASKNFLCKVSIGKHAYMRIQLVYYAYVYVQ